MSDPTNKTEQASARFSKTVAETTERLEKEAQEFVKYLNDEVVPTVRQHSTKVLRSAAEKLQELANYMEQHSSTTK
jgi:F0F1-type ATP synthase membrane subunit b/b'